MHTLVRTVQADVSAPLALNALTETQLQHQAMQIRRQIRQASALSGSFPESLEQTLENRFHLCMSELEARKASRARLRMYRQAA